jgi:hypothetical protein
MDNVILYEYLIFSTGRRLSSPAGRGKYIRRTRTLATGLSLVASAEYGIVCRNMAFARVTLRSGRYETALTTQAKRPANSAYRFSFQKAVTKCERNDLKTSRPTNSAPGNWAGRKTLCAENYITELPTDWQEKFRLKGRESTRNSGHIRDR